MGRSTRESQRRSHYSYTTYADRVTAERFEASRFGGPIGEWLRESQERVLVAFLGDVRGRQVLDVGTGSGRAARTVARLGAQVTAMDASRAMLRVARERAGADGLSIRWVEGDAHQLPFENRTFDAAVCLRVLMHTPEWRTCLGELCRVARKRVVIDYPALLSAAALQAGWRALLATLGQRVEAYRVFTGRTMRRELARHGFTVTGIEKQCVLPIGFHRLLHSRTASERVERLLARLGLLAIMGSPVTIVAGRKEGE